jgi:hypothetical protein
MIAGAVMLPVGFVAAMFGAVGGGISASGGIYGSSREFPPAAAVPIALGGAVLITGIVFLAIGAPKVPAETQPAPGAEPPRTPPQVSVAPLIGVGSAGMLLSF